MKIEKALALVVGEYNKCKDNPHIKKPVSYAVYKAWKWCDANEKGRRYCDRNICASNEVNGISCDECVIAQNYNVEDDDSPCQNCGEEDGRE